MPMTLSQWLQLLLLALLWSIAYTFVGFALRELPPLTLVLCRLALAAAMLAVVVHAMALAWPRGPKEWAPFVVMSVFNNVIPFSLIARGQQDIASGLASVIIATTPLWTVVLTRVFRPAETIGAMRLAGLALGVAGVAVLFGPEAMAGRGTLFQGMVLVLVAAMSYGCAGVWGARFRDVPPILASCCQLVGSALILLPLSLIVDRPWNLPMPGLLTVSSIVALSVLSTVVAYIVFYRVLAAVGGTNVMLVTLIMPPLSIALGIALLAETFQPRYAAGAAIIALALVVIDGRAPRAVLHRLSLGS